MDISRKEKVKKFYSDIASDRSAWIQKNEYYYQEDLRYLKFLIPQGKKILELGCGTGALLDALQPSYGLGIDFSEKMVEEARKQFAHLEFMLGDIEDRSLFKNIDAQFDYVIVSDTIGLLEDCELMLNNVHSVCSEETRVVISYFSRLWWPVLKTAENLGLKMPSTQQNWLSADDIENLLTISDFGTIKREWKILSPKRLAGIGRFINRFFANLPLVRGLCIKNYVVARPLNENIDEQLATTVVIPCRNEQGNIENAVKRLPRFCEDLEIIFVEGGSTDDTQSEIKRVIQKYKQYDIKMFVQEGQGKGDAVRMGFNAARGDVLIILDADLTVPPEQIPKFYKAILNKKGDFINGSRLVYPMEKQAMRLLNNIANHVFAGLFSWLLNQRITDTLCGTKALKKQHYLEIAKNRSYFGDFDPFGDFDLIFGAAKQNLKIIDLPIRYASRTYGETQISRFSHGWLLCRMVLFAYTKLKAL